MSDLRFPLSVSPWLWLPTCGPAQMACLFLPPFSPPLPTPFSSSHNSVRRMNISQLCDVLSRRMEPNNGISSYYFDESQGNNLHQGRTACIKYVHSIKKKKKLKNKILPTWGSELCRVYAVIPFAIQARNIPERPLGARSLEWGKGSHCNYKSRASGEVSGTGKVSGKCS